MLGLVQLVTTALAINPASHRLGVCTSSEVAAWASGHVKRQLAFWTAAPYARPLVERYLQMRSNVSHACRLAHTKHKRQRAFCEQQNLAKLVLVQIIDGSMHLHTSHSGDAKGNYVDAFTWNVAAHLLTAFRQMKQRGWAGHDTTFILTSHASMDQFAAGLSEIGPLFIACMRTKGTLVNRAVLLPRPYKIWAVDQLQAEIARAGRPLWNKQLGVAIFRGALSHYGRVALLRRAGCSNLTNIACTLLPGGSLRAPPENWGPSGAKWHIGGPAKWVQTYELDACSPSAKISMVEQQQTYRYVIVPNGVGCADRLRELLASSAVILLQTSDLSEFWQHDLRPYRNYLPVASDFSDLETVIAWAEQRPRMMMAMVARNQEYADKFLTSGPALCYLSVLLAEYGKLFQPSSTLLRGEGGRSVDMGPLTPGADTLPNPLCGKCLENDGRTSPAPSIKRELHSPKKSYIHQNKHEKKTRPRPSWLTHWSARMGRRLQLRRSLGANVSLSRRCPQAGGALIVPE